MLLLAFVAWVVGATLTGPTDGRIAIVGQLLRPEWEVGGKCMPSSMPRLDYFASLTDGWGDISWSKAVSPGVLRRARELLASLENRGIFSSPRIEATRGGELNLEWRRSDERHFFLHFRDKGESADVACGDVETEFDDDAKLLARVLQYLKEVG